MGKWADAADGITPTNNKAKGCALGHLLDSLPPDERAELQGIIDDACRNIDLHEGRYTYIADVIKLASGIAINTQCISRHVRGEDTCRTS